MLVMTVHLVVELHVHEEAVHVGLQHVSADQMRQTCRDDNRHTDTGEEMAGRLSGQDEQKYVRKSSRQERL